MAQLPGVPTSGLMISGAPPKALMFDKCLVPEDYRYDFTEWTLNTTEQPAGGIVVEKDRVTITKFRPNVPILLSNFTGTGQGNTPTNSEICLETALSQIIISGIEDNSSKFTSYQEKNIRRYWSNVTLGGLWFGPVYTYQGANKALPICTDISSVDGDVIRYADNTTGEVGSDGYLRGTGGGYGQFIHVTDKKDTTTPNWVELPSPFYEQAESPYYGWGPGAYWQMGIILFTSYTADQDGYITLTTPIVLRQENYSIVDPTTVEGYRAALGYTPLYGKDMTFQNVLMAHKFAFKETGTYTETIQGRHDVILSHYGNEQNTAFVISTRNYDSLYEHLRAPYITDFSTLISSNFPFKFWAKLERDNHYSHIWDSLVDGFYSAAITDGDFADHLFATSTGDIGNLRLNFNVGANTYIALNSIFDHSGLTSSVYFNIQSGILKSLHNAFRQSRRLQTVSFSREVAISDFSGAFEGAVMVNFPSNVVPANMWFDESELSEPTCMINYAADGSALQQFGNYKNQSALDPEDMCYIMTVDPQCYGAFRANDLSEIKYLLDMKFVAPIAWNIIDDGPDSIYNNAVFYAPNLAIAYIKNLNKGDWSLDGVKRNGVCAGNLTEFDEDCANYMLSNMFDLRLNTSMQSRLESDFNSFNDWTASSGTKRPVIWETWETSTLRKSVYPSGQMKINVALNNCTLSVTNGGNTTTVGTGDQTLNLSSGETIFTFTKTDANQDMSGVLTLTEPFMSELTQGLSSANIYLPADWGTREIISQAALTEANARGWNVYVGGQLYTTLQ